MGFRSALNSLLGKTSLPRASLEKLFALSAASITMETAFFIKPSKKAGICLKPIDAPKFQTVRTEVEELLAYSSKETGTQFRVTTDEFNFTWIILEDPDFDELITGVHLAGQTFLESGLGAYLLWAVFRFENEKPVYWIYHFKQGLYYPFIPGPGKTRDNAAEFRMRSLLEREIPIEKEVSKWYPLWGIPL
jgi:hypothetical protein